MGCIKVAAPVVGNVDYEVFHALFPQSGHGFAEFGIGFLGKPRYAYIAGLRVGHI